GWASRPALCWPLSSGKRAGQEAYPTLLTSSLTQEGFSDYAPFFEDAPSSFCAPEPVPRRGSFGYCAVRQTPAESSRLRLVARDSKPNAFARRQVPRLCALPTRGRRPACSAQSRDRQGNPRERRYSAASPRE